MNAAKILLLFSPFILASSCYAYAAPSSSGGAVSPTFVEINYDDNTYLSENVKNEKHQDLLALNDKKAPYAFHEPTISPKEDVSEINTKPETNTEKILKEENQAPEITPPTTNYGEYESGYSQEGTSLKQTELYSQLQCFEDVCKYTLLPNTIRKANIHIEKLDTAKIIFQAHEPFYFEVKDEETQAKIQKNVITLDDLNHNHITLVAGKMNTDLNIDFTNYTKEAYEQKSQSVNDSLYSAFIFLVASLLIGFGIYSYLEEESDKKD